MTVLDEIQALISQQSPNAICDDCITGMLGLSIRQHANQKTRQLAADRGYERRKGECSRCAASKLIIRSI